MADSGQPNTETHCTDTCNG